MSEPRRSRVVLDDARTDVQEPSTGTDTVTVACKLPNGLILELDELRDHVVESHGQRWHEKRAYPTGQQYVLHGNSVNMGAMAAGQMPDHLIVGGYGLTPGIPRDFWEKWSATRGKSFVDAGVVFAASNEARARSQAKERETVRSGLEPIDPQNPGPRAGIRRGAIEQATIA